jgi:hypothetical protein
MERLKQIGLTVESILQFDEGKVSTAYFFDELLNSCL